jgi:uncharacterized protein YpiB (UPF0302 family)
MSAKVSLTEKKDFIRWLLNNYQLKRRECVWIFNYLVSHEALLEKVVFVEDGIQNCPRGMIMSTHCVEGVAFKYYKENVMTTDAEKAFHDIRLNRDEPIYVKINFGGINHVQYVSVIEDNPYVPEVKQKKSKDSSEVDKLCEKVLSERELKLLEEKVDESLVTLNKESFMLYSKLYTKAKKSYDNKFQKK